MKIVIVTSNLAPYRVAWAEELSKYAEITIIYTKNHDIERDDRWLMNESKECKLLKLKNEKNKQNPICLDLFRNISPSDILIFDGYGPYTNLLGIIFYGIIGRKYYVNIDGYAINTENNIFLKYAKKLIFSFRNNYILCSGDKTRRHLMDCGISGDKIYTHLFSSLKEVDILPRVLTYDEKNEYKKELGIKAEKMILSVGRFIDSKNFEQLIKVSKKFEKNWVTYIVGGVPNEKYLRLAGNSKNIRFIDLINKKELMKYYLSADLFVMPSKSDVWGLVINEAMSTGLPIIATDKCIASFELISNNENGFIYESENDERLEFYVNFVLNDDQLQNKMAKKSLEKIRNYTIEEMAKKHLRIFQYTESK